MTKNEKKALRRTLEIPVDGPANIVTGNYTFEQTQKFVGGCVERVRVRFEGKIAMMHVDEEGILKGKSLNRQATKLYQDAYPGHSELAIFGPAVVGINHQFGD